MSTNCRRDAWSPETVVGTTSSMKPGPSGCSSPWMSRTISAFTEVAPSALTMNWTVSPSVTLMWSV